MWLLLKRNELKNLVNKYLTKMLCGHKAFKIVKHSQHGWRFTSMNDSPPQRIHQHKGFTSWRIHQWEGFTRVKHSWVGSIHQPTGLPVIPGDLPVIPRNLPVTPGDLPVIPRGLPVIPRDLCVIPTGRGLHVILTYRDLHVIPLAGDYVWYPLAGVYLWFPEFHMGRSLYIKNDPHKLCHSVWRSVTQSATHLFGR